MLGLAGGSGTILTTPGAHPLPPATSPQPHGDEETTCRRGKHAAAALELFLQLGIGGSLLKATSTGLCTWLLNLYKVFTYPIFQYIYIFSCSSPGALLCLWLDRL